MLILLPPSETKRSGGDGGALDLRRLALPSLTPQREATLTALEALSRDAATAARILRLGARQLGEIAVNAGIRTSPTLPAIDRYTGVLYDALGAASLDSRARSWIGRHVMIHSAALGPVGALDPIPAYRLAAGVSLPGIPPLRRLWADAVGAALTQAAPRLVLDLRSESYVALGPVPAALPSAYLRVMTEGSDGVTRALNHFNKRAKGEFVRTLATQRPRLGSLAAMRRWAADAGWTIRDGPAGEWRLSAD